MRVSMIELDSTDNVDLLMQLSGTGRARHLSNSTAWNAFIVGQREANSTQWNCQIVIERRVPIMSSNAGRLS
ncbi:MAG: hypothetical protein CPSOU_4623 [uncultured Paraburkholderia sp.]|nr:MAG: hypothetical protein CPSOU_4623 [uncultured Paraburkholderia sp.]